MASRQPVIDSRDILEVLAPFVAGAPDLPANFDPGSRGGSYPAMDAASEGWNPAEGWDTGIASAPSSIPVRQQAASTPPIAGPLGSLLSPDVMAALSAERSRIAQRPTSPAGRAWDEFTTNFGRQRSYVSPEQETLGLAVTQQKLEEQAQKKRDVVLGQITQAYKAWADMPSEDRKTWGPSLQEALGNAMTGVGLKNIPNLFADTDPDTAISGFGFISDNSVAPERRAAAAQELNKVRKDPVKQAEIIKRYEQREVAEWADKLDGALPTIVQDLKMASGKKAEDEIPEALVYEYAAKQGLGSYGMRALKEALGPKGAGSTLGVVSGETAAKRQAQKPDKDEIPGVPKTWEGYIRKHPGFTNARVASGKSVRDTWMALDPVLQSKYMDEARTQFNLDEKNKAININVQSEAGRIQNMENRPYAYSPLFASGHVPFDKRTGLPIQNYAQRDEGPMIRDGNTAVLNKDDAKHMAELLKEEQRIRTWGQIAEKLPSGVSGEALMNGATEHVAYWFGRDNALNVIKGLEGSLGQVARSIGSERGVLTDRDIGRAMQVFGTVWNSREQIKTRLSLLKDMIDLDRKITLGLTTTEEAQKLMSQKFDAALKRKVSVGNATGRQ